VNTFDFVDNRGYNEPEVIKMYNLHVRPERELRNNFSEISKLNKELDAVILTNRGKGTHVLLSFEEFDDYEEYRHNRYLLQKIKEAEADTKTVNHEDVWQKLGEKYAL
jgi:PHD/YefM family antitoxin component YafN of YafNO toxin-antitoxin module